MNAIHFNVEAVEMFCNQLLARRDGLTERMADERNLYDAVFDGWRDHRGESVKMRLEELARTIQSIASDLDDLVLALREQVRAAQEYLGGSERW